MGVAVKASEEILAVATGKVDIVEVLNKKDLKKWVRFPNTLYKGNKNFVPFLENDELDTFSGSAEKKSRVCVL